MNGPMSTVLNANHPRRRSPRLKNLNVLCEAKSDVTVDLSSQVQKCGKVNDSVLSKQIKCEMLEQEDDSYTRQPSDDINVLPDSAADEIGLIDITLKDLRERLKVKKRKLKKSISPSKVGIVSKSSSNQSEMENHDRIEVKQEELDLEEPLIILKLKRSKGSAANNKRRKSVNVTSVPLFSKEVVTTLPIGTTNSEVSDEGTTVLDLKTIKDNHILEAGNCLIPSVAGNIHELNYHVKTEIVETSSLDYQMEDCNAISSTSSAVFLLKDEQNNCSTTLSLDNFDKASSLSVSEVPRVDCPKDDIFKEPEIGTLVDRHTFPRADSNACFIGKLGSPEDSPKTLFDNNNEDMLQSKRFDSMPSNSQLSRDSEVSAEHRESKNYAIISEIGEEQNGEMDEVLSMPKHNVIPSASEDMPGPLDCGDHKSMSACTSTDHLYSSCIKSQNVFPEAITIEQTSEEMNGLIASQSIELINANELRANEGTEDLANGIPLEKMPVCIQVKDATDEHNILCKEVYGLEEIFLSGKENQCCGDVVHDAVPGHSLCSLPLSKRCSTVGNELHQSNKSSTKREFFAKLEDTLNEQAQKTTNFSGEISSLSNLDGPRELDVQSCREAPLFIRKDLKSTSNQPLISATSWTVPPIDKVPECDQEFMEDHPPKKLLSNRKIISPTSQEKLCQALRDIDLHDASQVAAKRERLSFESWTKIKAPSLVPGHKEVDLFLQPEQVNKKNRNHFNGHFAVKKVTFKSQETSARTIHMHMEKAIEFSQRQMHDIERLSTQFLKGLNSMKSIVEEALVLQAHSSIPSKFSAEEIRAASQDASELEKTTKRWLSIMTKDCNRFCKIMRSADSKSSALGNAVRKERKITFADEVGGMLCHVKVFEQQPSSPNSLEDEQGDR